MTIQLKTSEANGNLGAITVGPIALKDGSIALSLNQGSLSLGYGKIVTLSTGSKGVAIRTKAEVIRSTGCPSVLSIPITDEQEQAIERALTDYAKWLKETK